MITPSLPTSSAMIETSAFGSRGAAIACQRHIDQQRLDQLGLEAQLDDIATALDETAELLTPGSWIKGSNALNHFDCETDPSNLDVVAFCIQGALLRCRSTWASRTFQLAMLLLHDAVVRHTSGHYSDLFTFNDSTATTLDDAKAVVRLASMTARHGLSHSPGG